MTGSERGMIRNVQESKKRDKILFVVSAPRLNGLTATMAHRRSTILSEARLAWMRLQKRLPLLARFWTTVASEALS